MSFDFLLLQNQRILTLTTLIQLRTFFFLLDDVLFQVMTPFFIIKYLFIHKIV